MTRHVPQWLQSGTYAAAADRSLLGALWPSPAISGCAVTAAGVGMDIHVDPGQVAVPTANNTGTVLCTSDAIETIPTGPGGILPAPPAGTDRIDLIVCQPRSIDLDGVSTQEDFIFAAVTGAEGAPPGAVPATPAGTVALARVHIAGGVASLTAADITDVRPLTALAVPAPPAVGADARLVKIGWQDHYQGSKAPGTYDSTPLALPVPTYGPSNLVLNVGGHHGFGGGANGSMNYTFRMRRGGVDTDLISSGALQVPWAGVSTAVPFRVGAPGGNPITVNPTDAISVYFHFVVGGTNNYFAPVVQYFFTPR